MYKKLCERILLTTDDGINSPGFKILYDCARHLTNDLWVVAPDGDRSGTAMSLTITKPLYFTEHRNKFYSVTGTPSDCIVMAYRHLMKKAKPSLILSGVNNGSNIGYEHNLSGTSGGALMGCLLGVPSLSLSQDTKSRITTKWSTTKAVLPKLLSIILKRGWNPSTVPAINIPNCKSSKIRGIRNCMTTRHNVNLGLERRINPRHEEYYWMEVLDKKTQHEKNSDWKALAENYIAYTLISPDRGCVDQSWPLEDFQW